MQDVMVADGTGLAAFVRNRYFYGKLLDVHHLEMEQRYLNEKRWLVNRLGLGTGVLCGLELEADDASRVVVRPGVAIDGRGREIVVSSPYVIEDPLALTDACGRPTGERAKEMATLLLCFHECDAEPAPVLVSDCDVREECRPGAVRERFRIVVRDGGPDLASPVDCGDLGGGGPQPSNGGDASHIASMLRHGLGEREPAAVDVRRLAVFRALCGRVDTGCMAPEDTCVPIGVVGPAIRDGEEEGGDGAVGVIDCGTRVPIFSNVVLLDLTICLLNVFARAAIAPVLHYEQGDAQLVAPKTEFGVAARLTDPTGAPLAGEDVTFRVRAGGGAVGDGTAFATELVATTDDAGRVGAQWQIGEGPGLNTLEAEGRRGALTVFHALAQEGD